MKILIYSLPFCFLTHIFFLSFPKQQFVDLATKQMASALVRTNVSVEWAGRAMIAPSVSSIPTANTATAT